VHYAAYLSVLDRIRVLDGGVASFK